MCEGDSESEGGRTTRRSRGAWKLRNAASKMVVAAAFTCGWKNFKHVLHPLPIHHTSTSPSPTNKNSSAVIPSTTKNSSVEQREEIDCTVITKINDNDITNKNLCTICLDPVSYNSKGSNTGEAIFTAECSHAFHIECISSHVRHGNVTCPICRAQWTHLPHNLNNNLSGSTISINQRDPILKILDDSIATFRIHRRAILRSTRYDDDDPVESEDAPDIPKLCFSLLCSPHTLSCSSSSLLQSQLCNIKSSKKSYISVKLAEEHATDLVLVACPNGPHLRLLKQAMALVVFSLRDIDRLAVVTYSSSAARVLPLRRMTSYGKRTALQVIERLFYMGQVDPVEGLRKGIKILEDRIHKNLKSCILHLSDNPSRPYHAINIELPSTPIHRFHVGFGSGSSNGFVIQEFERFLSKILRGLVRDILLRIRATGEDVGSGRVIRIAEMRSGEERKMLLDIGECTRVCVEYSYTEGDIDECVRRTGETVVGIGDHKGSVTEVAEETMKDMNTIGRTSSVESWDFHDPYMARRWAKHLQGHRL